MEKRINDLFKSIRGKKADLTISEIVKIVIVIVVLGICVFGVMFLIKGKGFGEDGLIAAVKRALHFGSV